MTRAAIVEREGLGAISGDDGGLGEVVDRGDRRRPRRRRQGPRRQPKAIGPLVGYVMRETKGRADGGEVTRMLLERLQAE